MIPFRLGSRLKRKTTRSQSMIRNLKVLIAAAMALMAIGAVSASGAQAAEFHCSVQPCQLKLKPDGAVPSKTAHHVFIVKNSLGQTISFTCNELAGTATSATKTFTTATVTGLAYNGCVLQVDLSVVKVRPNECTYTLTSHGKVGATCPAGKVIEVETSLKCVMKIGTFAHLSGITYHNIGTTPNREVTVETLVKGIPVSSSSTKAECGEFDPSKTPLTGEYTTGNTIATAESDDGKGTMLDGWWE
jgi:hypothetical protein